MVDQRWFVLFDDFEADTEWVRTVFPCVKKRRRGVVGGILQGHMENRQLEAAAANVEGSVHRSEADPSVQILLDCYHGNFRCKDVCEWPYGLKRGPRHDVQRCCCGCVWPLPIAAHLEEVKKQEARRTRTDLGGFL